MPVLIIVKWEISIRDCEFNNFIKLIKGKGRENSIGYSEKTSLCSFMTKNRLNLLDIIELKDCEYISIKNKLTARARVTNFFNVLDICRKIINEGRSGKNILKYLLFIMNNTVIKSQYKSMQNMKLSNLYSGNGVIPFDRLPFAFSPISHNPPFSILIQCFDSNRHKPEMFARYIKNNIERNGELFTSIKDIDESEKNIKKLITSYNEKLWEGHRPNNELKIDKGQIFIQEYVKEYRFIMDKLKEFSKKGVSNYKKSVEIWLRYKNNRVDCEEKKEIIKSMFANSTVAILYGAAGTGKSTLINHISNFFSDKNKLFLSQTHPAVDNLNRKVNASNCVFMTIAKFISDETILTKYDILVIDECSTVSNCDMRKILEKASFNILILVGDTYQIESIRFGNWFNIARQFIPKTSLSELTRTYRSNDSKLIELWKGIRKMDNNILELLTKQKYSNNLDDSVFKSFYDDEIILCLNYDGLYGVNNINRFLQENNPHKPVLWGIQTFKVGDPILFHDSDRFGSEIYNNMKGRILNVSIFSSGNIDERIEFDIELDKVISGIDAKKSEFDLLEDNIYNDTNNSVIRFSVYKNNNADEDKFDSRTIIPFQVSYAVSIHKAQGLEYNSVKVVITNEVDEMITHNIFYTAITRVKRHLRIYWSPEVENKILSTIKSKKNSKDSELLYKVNL